MSTRSTLQPLSATAPMLWLAPHLGVRRGRVHEFCGRSRHVLALMAAGACQGPVIWALPDHSRLVPFPAGAAQFMDPARLLLVRGRTALDLLWTVEEALRAGSVGLAVAELAEPPGLTQVRRLHLAAEAGGGQACGVLMTPGQGGAQGIESRWQMDPIPGGGWIADRLRARMAPPLRLTVPPPEPQKPLGKEP